MFGRLLLIFVFGLSSTSISAQSENFSEILRACRLAQSSMSGGEGSQSEIREAADMLTGTLWNPLILQNVDVRKEESIKNHLVFSPEFLKDVVDDRSVYRRAKEYAEEQMSEQRGGNVFLCTKCIKGRGQVVYAIRHHGGTFNIAAVAEINGLINLSVVVKDSHGNESKPYKVSSNEFKGDSYRILNNIPIPKGNSVIYITLENKSKRAKSVAVIAEY